MTSYDQERRAALLATRATELVLPTPLELYAQVAARLHQGRLALGLTRAQLAARVARSDSEPERAAWAQRIYKVESERARVSLYAAFALARAMRRSLDELCAADQQTPQRLRAAARVPAKRGPRAIRPLEPLDGGSE